MLRTNSNIRMSVVIASVFTASVLGCASPGVPKLIGPSDLASLAGKWAGTLNLPSGSPVEGTLVISPNGDYFAQAGAFVARGQTQVKDGSLVFVPAYTSGGLGLQTGQRTSAATLSERPDGTLVLTGNGHSDTGPFSFEVTRQK